MARIGCSRAEAGDAQSSPVVSLTGLTKRFAGSPVIADLDLEVATGQSLALIGANGTGKSTLLRLIVRLVEADQGSIRLVAMTGRGDEESRRRSRDEGFDVLLVKPADLDELREVLRRTAGPPRREALMS